VKVETITADSSDFKKVHHNHNADSTKSLPDLNKSLLKSSPPSQKRDTSQQRHDPVDISFDFEQLQEGSVSNMNVSNNLKSHTNTHKTEAEFDNLQTEVRHRQAIISNLFMFEKLKKYPNFYDFADAYLKFKTEANSSVNPDSCDETIEFFASVLRLKNVEPLLQLIKDKVSSGYTSRDMVKFIQTTPEYKSFNNEFLNDPVETAEVLIYMVRQNTQDDTLDVDNQEEDLDILIEEIEVTKQINYRGGGQSGSSHHVSRKSPEYVVSSDDDEIVPRDKERVVSRKNKVSCTSEPISLSRQRTPPQRQSNKNKKQTKGCNKGVQVVNLESDDDDEITIVN